MGKERCFLGWVFRGYLTMKSTDARNKNLPELCQQLGLKRDPTDKQQWRGDGHRITLKGFAWFDHDAGHGSGGAIDLAMHVLHCTYQQALDFISGFGDDLPTLKNTAEAKQYQKPPESVGENFRAVSDYLQGRGINPAVIEWLNRRGMLYADRYSNCVFMYGMDACELRGTGAMQWRSSRGKFERGFMLPATDGIGVAVLESAIDAISYRQLHPNNYAVAIGGNSNDTIMTGCVGFALEKQLPVIAAFDTDSGGDIATARLKELATSQGVVFEVNRPNTHGCKDWNDQLTLLNKKRQLVKK